MEHAEQRPNSTVAGSSTHQFLGGLGPDRSEQTLLIWRCSSAHEVHEYISFGHLDLQQSARKQSIAHSLWLSFPSTTSRQTTAHFFHQSQTCCVLPVDERHSITVQFGACASGCRTSVNKAIVVSNLHGSNPKKRCTVFSIFSTILTTS